MSRVETSGRDNLRLEVKGKLKGQCCMNCGFYSFEENVCILTFPYSHGNLDIKQENEWCSRWTKEK